MIELNVYISGTSTDEDFRRKLGEIRSFIMERMVGEDFITLEVRAYETNDLPGMYRPYTTSPIMYNRPRATPTSLFSEPEPAKATVYTNGYVVVSREEAEQVLEKMSDILEQYTAVSLSDVKEMLGLAPVHADTQVGWISLEGIQVRQIREGWLIDLPEPEALTGESN
jgi:hypothetical protein